MLPIDFVGCIAGSLPSSYLGLPLCIGVASKSLWSPELERLEKKLSNGRRLTYLMEAE